MHKVASVLVVAAVCCSSSAVAQERQTFTTAWYFRVDYPSSGQYSESTDASAAGRLLMPTGSRWACEREPVSLTREGVLMAGFRCFSQHGFAAVLATCAGTKEDEDRAKAVIGDTAGAVILVARCATIANRPRVAAPVGEKRI